MAASPDVFRSPFQTAPLDLSTDAFYPSRRQIIENRLQVCWRLRANICLLMSDQIDSSVISNPQKLSHAVLLHSFVKNCCSTMMCSVYYAQLNK